MQPQRGDHSLAQGKERSDAALGYRPPKQTKAL